MLENPAINTVIGKTTTDNSVGVLNQFLTNFITIAFGLGGIFLMFMLLWGAYEYITSGGDKENVQKATKKLTTALIGICILFSVYAIIAIVELIFGINLINITVPTFTT